MIYSFPQSVSRARSIVNALLLFGTWFLCGVVF